MEIIKIVQMFKMEIIKIVQMFKMEIIKIVPNVQESAQDFVQDVIIEGF